MHSNAHVAAQRAIRNHLRRGRIRPPRPALLPYPVFIAYGSVPAARHAINRLAHLLGGPASSHQLQPMLWRFDQLADARWSEMALRDAVRASTLVLAMGAGGGLGADAEAWLSALTLRQRGATLSALAFVGDDEAWTISLRQTNASFAGQTLTRPEPPLIIPASPCAPVTAKAIAAIAA